MRRGRGEVAFEVVTLVLELEATREVGKGDVTLGMTIFGGEEFE